MTELLPTARSDALQRQLITLKPTRTRDFGGFAPRYCCPPAGFCLTCDCPSDCLSTAFLTFHYISTDFLLHFDCLSNVFRLTFDCPSVFRLTFDCLSSDFRLSFY